MSIPFLGALAPMTFSVMRPQPGIGWGWALFAALVILGVLATPSAIVFTIASHRVRRNSRISRGIPAASIVWRAGQYCHRCGLCFWPYPPTATVTARESIAPHQFTSIVWNAGGYANV
ncbi:hypothetical protein ACIBJI_34695 [Nocardia sp. NPDC050408]|uniref:hypothetical protein n=1 Tax=Nocardia sp. NPDC050408 TaxID=3364319 RepID=UPI0037B00998